MENRCKFWLPKKKRSCANTPLYDSPYCGNHNQRSDGEFVPCPIDPSHNVLKDNQEGHIKRCPLLKQSQSLSLSPTFLRQGNQCRRRRRGEETASVNVITSEMKRNYVYNMSATELCCLIKKIESIYSSVCKDICDSYKIPEACNVWINREIDRKLPFQEKHVVQQASILGNLEEFGVLKNLVLKDQSVGEQNGDGDDDGVSAMVEFGAGRGYLTQMLADFYGIKKVFLVERVIQAQVEDLKLNAVESLRGVPFLAIGKHLCGPATGNGWNHGVPF